MEQIVITCQKCRRTTTEEMDKILEGKSKFTQKATINCSNKKHEPLPSEYFCVNCNQYLCKKCFETHDKNPMYLNHKVTISTVDLQSKCSKHNEELVFYCEKCRYEICNVCLDSHKEHTLINLKELIFDHNIDELKKNFEEAEIKINQKNGEILEKSLLQLESSIDEIENDYFSNSKGKDYKAVEELKQYKQKLKDSADKCLKSNQKLLKFANIIFNNFIELKGKYNYFSIDNVKRNLRFNFKGIEIDKKTNFNNVLQYFDDFMIIAVYIPCIRCEGSGKVSKCMFNILIF